VRSSQGVRKIKKPSKDAYLGRIFDLGVCEGDTILILGHAEGKKLIWGYASTKSLRTPDLNKSDKKCKANIDIKLYVANNANVHSLKTKATKFLSSGRVDLQQNKNSTKSCSSSQGIHSMQQSLLNQLQLFSISLFLFRSCVVYV
jgi:hypothetical protein